MFLAFSLGRAQLHPVRPDFFGCHTRRPSMGSGLDHLIDHIEAAVHNAVAGHRVLAVRIVVDGRNLAVEYHRAEGPTLLGRRSCAAKDY